MNPAVIAAWALLIEQIGRRAGELYTDWSAGSLTDEEFTARWCKMQSDLARADALWSTAAIKPSQQ